MAKRHLTQDSENNKVFFHSRNSYVILHTLFIQYVWLVGQGLGYFQLHTPHLF